MTISIKKPQTIQGYLDAFPENIRNILGEMRDVINKSAPEAVEAISYNIPTFKLNGRNLVHFAAFKNHIGFYPTSSGIKAFQKELSSYKSSKGAVQFPLDKPIPFELVRKIVEFRITQIRARKE